MSAYLNYHVMESPLSEDHDNYSPYGYEQTPLYTVHVGNVMHQRMALILVAVVAMVAMGIFLNQKNDTTPLAAGGGGIGRTNGRVFPTLHIFWRHLARVCRPYSTLGTTNCGLGSPTKSGSQHRRHHHAN